MKTADMLALSLKGLLRYKFRSILSAIGVVFGVASVISMMSIGEGAKQEVIDQLKFLGTNNISIDNVRGKNVIDPSEGLSMDDAERIASVLKDSIIVSPVRTNIGDYSYKGINSVFRTMAVLPQYFEINSMTLEKGRFFDDKDSVSKNMVCIIGAGLRKELFKFEDPIGKCIFLNGHCYTVIGFLGNINIPKPSVEVIKTHDINRDVYIPLSSEMSENIFIDRIAIKVFSDEKVVAAANIIKTILDRVHKGAAHYEIIIPRELLRQSYETRKTFTIVLVLISGITLLVGGIGIMNTMLLNITKRTKEIGIRRALGSTKNEILLQFLIESVLLTVIGGLMGIVIGYASSALIKYYAQWRIIVSVNAVFFAFIISVTVGVLSGLYPAYKASELDPETTLRSE